MKHIALCVVLSCASMPAKAASPSDGMMMDLSSHHNQTIGNLLSKTTIVRSVVGIDDGDEKINAIRQKFSQDVENIARQPGIGTCFGGFLNGVSNQSAIEQSTVMLVAEDAKGHTMAIGSGFVVRDSALDGHNRIVSARHVVNEADFDQLSEALVSLKKSLQSQHLGVVNREVLSSFLLEHTPGYPDIDGVVSDIMTSLDSLSSEAKRRLHTLLKVPLFDHIDAYASDGFFLGRFGVVAMGQPDGQKTDPGGDDPDSVNPHDIDWSVLRFDASFNSEDMARRYDAISGLSLSPIQGTQKSVGMSGDGARPAATHGYSGGPVLDAMGVHGVVSATAGNLTLLHAVVNGMLSPMAMRISLNHQYQRQSSDLPMKQVAVVNPLGNPTLLASLGNAGRGVRVSDNAPLYSQKNTKTFVGMPHALCGASATIQVKIGEVMPDPTTGRNSNVTVYAEQEKKN